MRRRTVLGATAAALGAAAVPAGIALAHDRVVATSPKAGSIASRSLTKVTVTLSGQIRSGTLRVTGPGDRRVSTGEDGVDPRNVRRLTVPLRSRLRSGRYTARWSAKVADGHTQRGSFTFRVR